MPKKRDRLQVGDVQGAWAILPTPATPDAWDWRAARTVRIDEATRAAEAMIAAGIDGILTLGTFGEGATLTLEEKVEFMGALAETVAGRIPLFGGTTSLNTRETVRQTKAACDLGLDGTMLGVPMWCKADLPTAVGFFRDVADAVPEMAICVYANVEAFKFEFPRPFWAQVCEIPQAICAKYLNIAQLTTDIKSTKGRIRFLTTEGDHYAAARIDPEECTAFWTSGACCDPWVSVALRDEVRAAKRSNDWARAKSIAEDVKAANATLFPRGDIAEFAKYNIGLEKARIDAAGWMQAGPCRPPYHRVPEEFLAGARKAGLAWAQLGRKYGGRQ
jgi:trans-o-hydroxybenzylidenepyruvate hydratase-aldolase